jgi:hypothetical protein
LQIFFDGFYGEGFEVKAGQSYTRQKDHRPYGGMKIIIITLWIADNMFVCLKGILWTGSGHVNSNRLDTSHNEFLVTPNTAATFTADATADLFIYVVFPFEY